MPEPAKDTAIDIAPKTQPTQGRVPKIAPEINRVASRVRDRNKKDDDRDDEVLENDGPTEITRIVRENTHPDKDKPRGRFAQISSRMIPLLVPIINCVFLARIDARASTLGVDARLGILSSPPPPPPPYSPPPPTVITQESMEYKTIVWNTNTISFYRYGTSFVEVMESEGVSEDERSDCSYPEAYTNAGNDAWKDVSNAQRTCVLTILVDKLLQKNWRLMSVPEYWNDEYGSVLFMRTNYTTPTVAVSTVPVPASAQVEHKSVFWNYLVSDLKTSLENEGISTTDMEVCITTTETDWNYISSSNKKCLVELLLSTLAKDNWTLATAHAFGYDTNQFAYHFTRPVQTS